MKKVHTLRLLIISIISLLIFSACSNSGNSTPEATVNEDTQSLQTTTLAPSSSSKVTEALAILNNSPQFKDSPLTLNTHNHRFYSQENYVLAFISIDTPVPHILFAFINTNSGYISMLQKYQRSAADSVVITNLLNNREVSIDNLSEYGDIATGRINPDKSLDFSMKTYGLYGDGQLPYVDILRNVSGGITTQTTFTCGRCHELARNLKLAEDTLAMVNFLTSAISMRGPGDVGGYLFDTHVIGPILGDIDEMGRDWLGIQPHYLTAARRELADCLRNSRPCPIAGIVGPTVSPKNPILQPGESRDVTVRIANITTATRDLVYFSHLLDPQMRITNNRNGEIEPARYKNITVRFTCPDDLKGYKVYRGIITIYSNDPEKPQVERPLSFRCKDDSVYIVSIGYTTNAARTGYCSTCEDRYWISDGTILEQNPKLPVDMPGFVNWYGRRRKESGLFRGDYGVVRRNLDAWHRQGADAILQEYMRIYLERFPDKEIVYAWHTLTDEYVTSFSGNNLFWAAVKDKND